MLISTISFYEVEKSVSFLVATSAQTGNRQKIFEILFFFPVKV